MMDAVISLPGLATTAITGTLTLTKPGTTPQLMTFPDASITVQGTREAQSSNFTPRLDGSFLATATLTTTDPSPSEGRGFTLLVRNGTATVGSTAYAIAGTLLDRTFHSGAWATYVYPHLAGAWTWTAAQTFGAAVTLSNVAGLRLSVNRADAGVAAEIVGGSTPTNASGKVQFGGGSFTASGDGYVGGILGLAVVPTANNGLLQLASGTTRANGIAFGTDTFFYRITAGSLAQDFAGTNNYSVRNLTNGVTSFLATSSSTGYAGTFTNHIFQLYSNNTPAVNIDTAQGVTTLAAVYAKNRLIIASAGTTVLDASDHIVFITGATTHTVTLPASANGRRITIKNRSTGTVTVNRAGADTIEGGTTTAVISGASIP